MGTAATMQVMAEALGMALPGSTIMPATSDDLSELAFEAGKHAVNLALSGLKPSDIMTLKSFENAIMVHAAIAGSTNALLHLPAIAHELNIEITPDLFDSIHRGKMCIRDSVITGWYTATEAAAFASLYTLIIGMFFYKTLKLSDLPKIMVETLSLSSLSLFALSAASALGELLGYYQISTIIEGLFVTYINQPWLFKVVVILFFLFVGTFMDAIPAMILFVPVILPIANNYGVSPVLPVSYTHLDVYKRQLDIGALA